MGRLDPTMLTHAAPYRIARLSGQLSQGGIIEATDVDTDPNFIFGGSYSLNGTNAINFCVCKVSGSTTRVTLQPNGTLNYENTNGKEFAIAVTAMIKAACRKGNNSFSCRKNEAPLVTGGRTMLLQSQYLKMPLPSTVCSNNIYGITDPDGDMTFSFEFEPWTY